MSTPNDMTSMSPLPLSNEGLPTQLESGGSPSVLSSSLPYPDPFSLNISPGQKKKSHARKQPAGHIPRPRNAFILFRCDFVRQKKVPDHLEANHRNISRIVGSVWKKMSASQKAPWIAMANTEKKNHAEAHPGYKYHPGYESRGRDARVKTIIQSPAEKGTRSGVSPAWTPSPSFTPPLAPLRRSSSCPPPGAFPVLGNSSLGLTQAKMLGISAPSMTKDDLARRPSRTIMYQSTAPLFSFGHQPTDPTPASTGNGLSSAQWWATDPGSASPLTTGPYTIAPPGDAPGWDAAPTKADTWYPWSEGNVGPHAIGHMDLCSTNDLSSNFTNLASQWNVPTFTNPFGSGSGTTSNDHSQILSWNLNHPVGNIVDQGPMSVEAQAPALPSNAFDPADHLQHTGSSGAYSMNDLDNLFRTRMSLIEDDTGVSKTEQAATDQPQFYWGTQDLGRDEDRDLLPILYLKDENGLYYNPLDEAHRAAGEGKGASESTHPTSGSAIYSSNEANQSPTTAEVHKEKTRKERRVRKSRVTPLLANYLPSNSPSTSSGTSTTPTLKNEFLPPSSARRPLLSSEDLRRLAENAGLNGNERVDPEKYLKFSASITEHYLKKISALKKESQRSEIPNSQETVDHDRDAEASASPAFQGDASALNRELLMFYQ